MKTLWHRYKTPLKIILGVLALTFVLRGVDWVRFGEELRSVEPLYIGVYVALQLIATAFSVLKWQRLSVVRGLTFSFWGGFQAYMLGTFLNNFFPGTLGGDVYRSTWLGRVSGEIKRGFYSVLFDRVQGLLVVMVIILVTGTLSFSFLQSEDLLRALYWLLVAGGIGGFVVLYLVLYRIPADSKWLFHNFFRETLRAIQKDARVYSWLPGSGWSALFFLVGPGLSNYALFLALGIQLPFLPFLFLTSLISVATAVPITLGNLGVKEGLYVILFLYLGVNTEQALLVVVLSRSLQLLISCTALPWYLKGDYSSPARGSA